MSHISIDEMLSVLQIKDLTPENIKAIGELNRHIYKCDECRERYNKLIEAVEAFDSYFEYDQDEVRIMMAYSKAVKKPFADIVPKFKNIIQNVRTEISVAVESLSKISILNPTSEFNFYHPVPIGQLKSTGPQSNEEYLSILTDEEHNQISVSQDGSLTLRLQNDICDDNQIVFLVPEDVNKEALASYSKKSFDDSIRVNFEDVEPGNYKIIL